MKILIVGASGTIGQAVVNALRPGNEVVGASRNGSVLVDLSDPNSIRRMYENVGKVYAIVSTAGSASLDLLTRSAMRTLTSDLATNSWARSIWFAMVWTLSMTADRSH